MSLETSMSNILIISHGEFAYGIKNSAEMIIGKQENLKTLAFYPEMSLDSLFESLKETIHSFNNDFPTLIFVDLFGGSPSNAVAMLLAEDFNIQAIAGVNLSMLLEVLGGRSIFPIEALAKQAFMVGSEGVVDIVKKFTEN